VAAQPVWQIFLTMFESAQTHHNRVNTLQPLHSLHSSRLQAAFVLKALMALGLQTLQLHQNAPDAWADLRVTAQAPAWNALPSSFYWLSTCAAFADSGGMVSGDGLAQRLFDSASSAGGAGGLQGATALVARWIASRSVVTVMGPHGWMLPLFQFDQATATPKPSMAPVLAVLRGVFSDAELALWFVSSNDWLKGDQPAMVMHKNLPGVLHAARADRYVATGH
jgi:hypothetical protein